MDKWKRIVRWTLLVAVIVYIISGLGILYPAVVGPLTFGLLGKGTAFTLHVNLLVPFLVLIVAHIALTWKA